MSLMPALTLVFMAFWAVTQAAGSEALVSLARVNAGVQIGWFVLAAAIPTARTGRMSWVDIAWPFGVFFIGAAALLLGDGHGPRRVAVAAVYSFIGLRMGVAALLMGRKTGVIFEHDFPRYRYRRDQLDAAGVRHPRVHMVVEVMAQGFANTSVLALPALLLATNPHPHISPLEVVGLSLWAIAYALESVADAQKLLFISRDGGTGVCDVGLWRYSRHPNYFAEWLVWTGLVVAAVPSWWALRATEPGPVWGALGVGTLAASGMMYTTLVYLTGAVPAEHFSALKRPGYRAYQARTSRFFPWFPRG